MLFIRIRDISYMLIVGYKVYALFRGIWVIYDIYCVVSIG